MTALISHTSFDSLDAHAMSVRDPYERARWLAAHTALDAAADLIAQTSTRGPGSLAARSVTCERLWWWPMTWRS